jgi:hypothetical protein
VNATEGGPALRDAGAAVPGSGAGGSGATPRSRALRLRTVLLLARVDARLLFRSILVLAGLLFGGLVIWIFIHSVEPVWWNASWQIGYGQVILGTAVLIAAHLSAGRARRDDMQELYGSLPASAGTRTLAQLIGLAGAAPASLLLIGGTAAAVEILGPIGVPSIAALAGGLLLVIAAGAAGIAIGTRFPHPLAGVLGALALFIPFSQSNRLSGAGSWLLAWVEPDGLGQLPGPLAGYPPAGAHAVELAGIAVLAGVVALAVTVRSAPARGGLATAGIVAAAAICLSGAVQLRPIPTADLNHLVREVADPASVQHCTTASQVRYCLYPGFGPELPSIQAPVSAVLARLPARPAQPLTVRQVAPLDPDLFAQFFATLTEGHPRQQVSRWNAQLQHAPGNYGTAASAVYLTAGSWPVGGPLADARFALALAAAQWAVHFPPVAAAAGPGMQCVPADQAREAIAIWLAILATRSPAAELRAGLPAGGYDTVQGVSAPAFIWDYPGEGAGYLASLGPQTTAAGYLLASAMSRLPEHRVARVLKDAWATWVNWHTTDAQLAAALGIPMPSVPTLPKPRPGVKITTVAGPRNPLCTT